jgi:uncharacterized Zn-binding protein involved in type VI secretion
MPPAIRVGDITAHGGTVVGPGAPNVLIGGQPAALVGDMHACPLVDPDGVPHVGGPILPPGVPTVLISGRPAVAAAGTATCVGPPDVLPMGFPTVLIGG